MKAIQRNKVALVVAAALVAGCAPHAAERKEDVRAVRSVAVGENAGSVGASYPGEVRARYESKLGFRIGGKVAQRLVDVGANVRAGQVLMRLDPEQEVLRNASSAAQVDATKSRVDQNRTDLARIEALFARKFASQAELDAARLALAESESQLANARAQNDMARNQRAYTELVADRAGVVTAIHAEAGQVVSAGAPAVILAGSGEREVVVSIPETRIAAIRDAKRMTVSLWSQPGRTYLAKLRELSPDTDDVSRTYAARVTIVEPGPEIRLGMTATVFTPDIEGARAIRLPLTAIYDSNGKPQVWIVDPRTSRVSARAVTLGAAEKDAVLIAGGLEPGEVVVTAGVNLLHPGQKVKTAGAKS
jgi:membrane fusion protein, multidrug efflux system